MNVHALMSKPCELHARVLLGNKLLVCSLANSLKIISLRQTRIDSVRYLRKLLPELTVVHYSPQQEGRVFFGAWVEIESELGEQKRFRIVGAEEIYGDAKNVISIDSPMARALLKRSVDESVVVNTPSGPKEWWINVIEYVPDFE